MLKKTRTKSETRFRCDSKEEKKNRIQQRSRRKKDRIRRRLKRKRNRIQRRSKKKESDRIRRRYRRQFKNATNDSKFESLILLRTNSTSTMTTTAYLINVAKHKKRIFYESFLKLHFSSSKL
jgi:hypothetical protein